jgi:peroxiredoxin
MSDVNLGGGILSAGTAAPDFTLRSQSGKKLSLNDYKGKPVILFFYPADWSPVCSEQSVLYNETLSLFEEHDAQLLGVSVDGAWSHRAFAENRNLNFPLLADFEPKGEVSRAYGAYHHESGTSLRAVFVIDAQGVIRWSYLSPNGVNPGAEGILTALEGLS